MALMKLRDDRTRLRVERGEEGGCAMPVIVMRAPLDLAGPHRHERLRPVQRLDLRFFVDAEHGRMLRRIQIQPDDIPHLVDEQRVVRRLIAMRLRSTALACRACSNASPRAGWFPAFE